MASKSPDAFRTISEVADWLETPAHVLRFWESKFTQVKPVKRAGGRRYYRPADMQLLGGIKRLLHDDGMTIKGVQKLLREHGVRHVAALSPPLDTDGPVPPPAAATVLDFPTGGSTSEPAPTAPEARPEETPETAAETTEDAPPPGDEAAGDTSHPEGTEPVLEDVCAAGFERDYELDSDIPETPPIGQAEVEAAPYIPAQEDVEEAARAEESEAKAEQETEPAPLLAPSPDSQVASEIVA
jgi:Predicted transcriptional regulators